MKWEIIKAFSVKDRNCFRFREVLAEFPDKDSSYLSKVLRTMVSKGILLKVYRDIYYIVPLNADPQTFSPDNRLVAKCMMNGKDYYLAFSTAMQILGLSHRPVFKTFVATNRQVQPQVRNIAGADIHFVTHSDSRFFGYEKIWISQLEQAMVSDVEKTIVDALSKPNLCGGFLEVGESIYRAKQRTDLQKLFYYLARNGSNAAKKRYLFLSHILELEWTSEHERMLDESGTSISVLDPSGIDKGKQNSRFGLKVNIEVNTLKSFSRSL